MYAQRAKFEMTGAYLSSSRCLESQPVRIVICRCVPTGTKTGESHHKVLTTSEGSRCSIPLLHQWLIYHVGQTVRSIASPRIKKHGAQLTQAKSPRRDTKDDPIPSCRDILQRSLVGPHLVLFCQQGYRLFKALNKINLLLQSRCMTCSMSTSTVYTLFFTYATVPTSSGLFVKYHRRDTFFQYKRKQKGRSCQLMCNPWFLRVGTKRKRNRIQRSQCCLPFQFSASASRTSPLVVISFMTRSCCCVVVPVLAIASKEGSGRKERREAGARWKIAREDVSPWSTVREKKEEVRTWKKHHFFDWSQGEGKKERVLIGVLRGVRTVTLRDSLCLHDRYFPIYACIHGCLFLHKTIPFLRSCP